MLVDLANGKHQLDKITELGKSSLQNRQANGIP
jgi:hypothetical protein